MGLEQKLSAYRVPFPMEDWTWIAQSWQVENKFRDCKQSVNMLKYIKPISYISRASLQFHILLLRLSLSIANEFDNIDNNNNGMTAGQNKNRYIS